MISRTYANGVIAAKEKYFLGDKLLRLIETDAASALRALKESGFGGENDGAENANFSSDETETLIAAEEAKTNAFIREYAGSEAEKEYFLAPLDCHNVKAYFKAKLTGAEETKMLAPEGALAVKKIAEAFETEDYSLLPAYLALAVAEAEKACEGGAAGKGAEVGAAFEKALYAHLFEICKGAGKARRALRGALKEKADLTNLVTALRSGSAETAAGQYVPCGALSAEDFSFCFAENTEQAEKLYNKACASASGSKKKTLKTVYELYRIAKESGSVAEAEKRLAETEIRLFEARKYELSGSEPFLYYVLRRKTECANVRAAMVCLNAGMKESEIKKRLRGL